MNSNDHHLFSDFPWVSKEEWEEKIRADLKDPAAMERLIWKSEEGFDIDPFYRPEDLKAFEYTGNLGPVRKPATAPNGWINCQEVFAGKEPEVAGEHILEALRAGAQAIRVRFSESSDYGLEELKIMLKHVPLAETELFFHGGMRIDALYEDLCETGRMHQVRPGLFKGGLGADPLGYMTSSGFPVAGMENLSRLIQKVVAQSPFLKTIEVNGSLFQDAGSTLVQELAFTLSQASEYMAVLADRGLDPSMIQESMRLNLATGPIFYMEIAKFRAARLLWSQLAEGYGIDPSTARITLHATTARWNRTLYDPYVNLLRNTTQAMSAVIGGTDYLTVLPFDDLTGTSTSFSRRLARNASIIIREEAYLDKVADPASGSYYLEHLTHQLGERAWDLFRKVESRGGFRKAFESGWIQQQVRESGNRKLKQVNDGQTKLIGTNAYPDSKQTVSSAEQESTMIRDHASLEALAPFRVSAPLEGIRMRVERTNPRPRIFLLKFGHPNWAISRASFASNFFASGGYEILDPSEFASIKDGVDKAYESKVKIVVLCSSDDEYAEISREIVDRLSQRSLIVVAGNPPSSRTHLEDLGIRHFIHRNSPMLETLQVINSIVLK